MNLRALRCRLTRSGTDLLDIAHWTGAPAALTEKAAAGVYLVADDALAWLRGLSPLVSDRGRKHPRRPLSRLLLKQASRIPLAHAPFTSHRQVRASLRVLLENAERLREQKAYLLAVPREIYERVAAQFAHPDAAGTLSGAASADGDWMDPEEVPPELEKRLTGTSREIHHVRQQIVRAAREDFPVLVQGDTGTGKDVVARSIHLLNEARRRQPFVPVNCGAIPTELFESEVFGYVPGAFTGALQQGSEGLWRSAKGGTLFLDEIGDLARGHQVKILRALQDGTIRPVGAQNYVPVAARVVAATNRDLYAMTESGEFRDDLYYRLASMVITVPPLRDRAEDVTQLAAIFWKELAPRRPPLSAEVLDELAHYRWRGNARELRYILSNLHTAFPKSVPTVERLQAVVRMRAPGANKDAVRGVDQAVWRLDALRHLRRAMTSVGAAQRLARRVASNGNDTAEGHMPLLAEVGACLAELQLLGVRPEHFERFETFEAVHRLAGGVAALQSRVAHGDATARRFAKKEVADLARSAASAVRRDQERHLKAL